MANTEREIIRNNKLFAIELCLKSGSCEGCRIHQFAKEDPKNRVFYRETCGKKIVQYMKELFEKSSMDSIINYAETIRLAEPEETKMRYREDVENDSTTNAAE
jgi:hypothetical protein